MLIRFPSLKVFLEPIDMGKEVVIDTIKGKGDISIRFIDANHCPGSSMIMITGPNGTVLHTGDFRYNGTKMLKEVGFTKIDYLYLDNTFCTPEEQFPC